MMVKCGESSHRAVPLSEGRMEKNGLLHCAFQGGSLMHSNASSRHYLKGESSLAKISFAKV